MPLADAQVDGVMSQAAPPNKARPQSCGIHAANAFPVHPRGFCLYNHLVRPTCFVSLQGDVGETLSLTAQIMPDAKPLILLPGMMADHRLLASQQTAFPNLVVPAWPEHRPSDTIGNFAERLADTLRPIGPCFVGGVSFGGVVALELARHLDSLGCILISSVRSSGELPLRFRLCRGAGFLSQSAFDTVTSVAVRSFRPSMPRAARRRSDRLLSSPFFCWATRAMLRWTACDPGVPIAQIHGDADLTFPVERTQPDQIVDRAGHMLVSTHSEIVNQFISQFIASRCSDHSSHPDRKRT